MIQRAFYKTKGFTLIELMIVLAILAITTPIIHRFYHEGVKKRFTYLNESGSILRGTQILFKYLEQDLHHARFLIASFGELKTDDNALIIKTMSPNERIRLLRKTGELSGDGPAKEKDCIVIYRLNNSKKEIIREVYEGRITLNSSVKSLSRENRQIVVPYGKDDKNNHHFIVHSLSHDVLLGDVDLINFTFDCQRISDVSCVRLLVSYVSKKRKLQSLEKAYRIFLVG